MGFISWEQLQTIILVACHGDPLFNADLTNYFKCKMGICFDEQGNAVRPRCIAATPTDEGQPEAEKAEPELESPRISLQELVTVVDQMDVWLTSTGWEWPTWMRPMSAGPMGPMQY